MLPTIIFFAVPFQYSDCPPSSFHQTNYTPQTQYFLLANPPHPHQQFSPSDSSHTAALTQLPTQIGTPGREAKFSRKRESNPHRELLSAKKNSESNIINQYFNFFGSAFCSKQSLLRIVHSLRGPRGEFKNIIACFYSAIRLIILKRGRTYINKSTLLSYFSEEGIQENFPAFIQKVSSSQICTVSELSLILRKSFFFYVREVCYNSIMTSKRISILSKEAHMRKLRNIIQFLSHRHTHS